MECRITSGPQYDPQPLPDLSEEQMARVLHEMYGEVEGDVLDSYDAALRRDPQRIAELSEDIYHADIAAAMTRKANERFLEGRK